MRNVVSGSAGQVVQASSIDSVYVYSEPRAPVPFQLPPAPRRFVSRREELAALDGWPLVVISGPGGVGKTTLALRWLHEQRGDFPDGQLYADLGAHAPDGPVAPEEVLEWFLSALGVPEVPVSLAARQAMFRSATAGRQFAVLLDNAASAAQVRPLLPAAGTVVVTSRWRLSSLGVDGARFVEVEPLGLTDSVRLLEQIVQDDRMAAEPDAAGELARLCGGLPVALSVVGARLSTRPRRSLERELRELRDDRLPGLSDEVSVETVLDLSYVGLPPRQARLYRLCAWLPGAWFGAEVAAAMAGEPVGDVADALEDLVEKNLLTEIADDRFRYHDMLRTHARSKRDDGRDAGLRTALQWYVDKSAAADLAAMPGHQRVGPVYRTARAMQDEPIAWFERERLNLMAALRSAHDHGWADLVWQLCEPLWPLFLHRHHYTDWVESHRLGIEAANACGQRLVAARLGNRLAMAYVNLHLYDEATAELDAVLAAGLDDPVSETTALSMLGRVHQGRGEPEAALHCYRRVLEVRTERGRDRGVGLARRRIGEALIELGRPEEAITELELAESLLTDPVERARVRTFLARACAESGHVDRARSLLGTARDELRDHPFHLADVFLLLAQLADDDVQARDHHRSALACYRDPTDPTAVRIRTVLDRYEHEAAPGVVPEQASGEQQRGGE